MMVEIRIYKQYDLDLFSLFDSGYPLSVLLKLVLENYANGIPTKLIFNDIVSYDNVNKHSAVRSRVYTDDENTIKMLASIKKRFRNSFCKTLIRNALTYQNINCFFENNGNEKLVRQNMDNDCVTIELDKLKDKKKIGSYVIKNNGLPEKKVETADNDDSNVIEHTIKSSTPSFLTQSIRSKIEENEENDDDIFDIFSNLSV